MEIFITQNNNEIVLQLPVNPEEIFVESEQLNERINTVQNGTILVPGKSGLRGLKIESFFPNQEYIFVKDETFKGIGYKRLIEYMISRELPMRIIMTGDYDLNMPMMINRFVSGIGQGKDIPYTLEIEEFKFPS